MIEQFKKLVHPKEGDKKYPWFFWLGLIGMGLILLSEFFTPAERDEPPARPAELQSLHGYTRELEKHLQQMVALVEGAGHTRVMITLEGSQETVYATDQRESSTGQETAHILLDTQAGEQALVEQTWQPEVRGVAVVCEGGGDVHVAARVTEMVSVLLGVPTNRISVAKMS